MKQSATRMLEAAYSEADGCYRIIGMPGFQIYDVDLWQGYTLLGQIDHDDFYAGDGCQYQWMRRTIIMGDSIQFLI